MTVMTFLPAAEIDPNSVRPGWVALLIVLALGAATVLLWRNMGKQLKKIDFDGDGADAPAPSDGPASTDSSAAPAGDAEPTGTTDTTPTQSDAKEHTKH
ncbi:hypothetical protein [Kribbella sp. NPDC049227]|uniref:hypothetical protein n=1 Tax=Kribbella sp. NPDC049227 TaxID=3364113 RepID=UPI00371853BA